MLAGCTFVGSADSAATAARRANDCLCKLFALYRSRRAQVGPVAQWSEPAAHNGLVAGSSPARPTRQTIDSNVF